MTKTLLVSSNVFSKFIFELGYTYHHQSGSHMIFRKEGKRSLSVPVRKEIGKGLLLSLLDQVGSTKDDFQQWYSKRFS